MTTVQTQEIIDVVDATEVATIQYTTPSQNALKAQADYFVEVANSLVVDSPVQYELAANQFRLVKEKKAQAETQRKAITQPIDAAKKAVMDLFRPYDEVYTSVENILKGKMIKYTQEQERIRLEQQAIANAEAAKERARLEKQAQRIEKKGDEDTAEALRVTAQVMVAPVVASATPVVKGISTRKTHKAEVVDILAFAQYIIANPQFKHMLQVNQVALNQYATMMKENAQMDGVSFKVEEVLVSRRG